MREPIGEGVEVTADSRGERGGVADDAGSVEPGVAGYNILTARSCPG